MSLIQFNVLQNVLELKVDYSELRLLTVVIHLDWLLLGTIIIGLIGYRTYCYILKVQ